MEVPAELQKQAMTLCQIDENEVKTYADTFSAFDTDGSGDIDLDELHQMINQLKKPGVEDISREDALNMLEKADVDGNGSIDFIEFCHLMTKNNEKKDDDPLKDVKAAFSVFDKDGNGTIDRAEVAQVLADLKMPIDSSGLDDIMNLVDTDGNGVIDFDEFCEMYRMLGLRGVSSLHNDPDAPSTTANSNFPALTLPNTEKCCIIS